MIENKTPVQAYKLQVFCTSCGDKLGHMLATGMSLMSSPPWYIHKCDICGIEKKFRSIYPRIIYE